MWMDGWMAGWMDGVCCWLEDCLVIRFYGQEYILNRYYNCIVEELTREIPFGVFGLCLILSYFKGKVSRLHRDIPRFLVLW